MNYYMYKIKYNYKSLEKLNNFILSFKNIYKELYFDTGLFNLDIIIESYIKKWDDLDFEIRYKIRKNLSEKEVFWYKIKNNKKSIKIYLKSFMLEVFYKDNLNYRTIEDIVINKK